MNAVIHVKCLEQVQITVNGHCWWGAGDPENQVPLHGGEEKPC